MNEDNSPELLRGCSCGSKVFLFLKKKEGEEDDEFLDRLLEPRLNDADLRSLDEHIGNNSNEPERIIKLDIENLLKLEKGRYRLNIASLMKGDPLVMKVRKGVYYIDIPYSMKKKTK